MGSRDHEPHIKHFLDMTQTELYERFRHEDNELNLGQRSFKKWKPWNVKINATRNTCCCRYHIEYTYYYDTYIHILHVLHNNLVQEWSTTLPRHHLESLSIASCVEGQKVAHFIKGLAQMGHAQGVVEWNFWTNAYMSLMSMNLGDMKWTYSHSNMSRMISVEGMKGKKYNWSPLRLAMSSWIVFFPIDIYCYFINVTTYWSIHL